MVGRGNPQTIQEEVGTQGLGQPQDQPARHSAGDVANAAEDGRRERFDAGDESHHKAHLLEHQGIQDTGRAGERAANDKGDDDDVVHVNPHQGGRLLVFGNGAHGLADARALNKELQARHHQGRGHDHQYLDIGHLQVTHLKSAVQRRDIGIDLDVGTIEAAEKVLQKERSADGGDQRHQARRKAQRPVGDALQEDGDDHGDEHGYEEDDQ